MSWDPIDFDVDIDVDGINICVLDFYLRDMMAYLKQGITPQNTRHYLPLQTNRREDGEGTVASGAESHNLPRACRRLRLVSLNPNPPKMSACPAVQLREYSIWNSESLKILMECRSCRQSAKYSVL